MATRRRMMSEADQLAAKRVRELWADYQKKHPGISQEVAAARANMTQSAFSQFLKGRVPMRVTPVMKMAKLFGVPPRSIRNDLGDLVYETSLPDQALAAMEPTLQPLTAESLEIARVFQEMTHQTQDFVRELLFHFAIIDKRYPWLRRGRPRSHTYAQFEKWHEDNRQLDLSLQAARIAKKHS